MPVIIILGFGLYGWAPHFLLNLTYLDWACLGLVLTIGFSPLGRLGIEKITSEPSTESVLRPAAWLGHAFLLALGLWCFYLGTMNLFQFLHPNDSIEVIHTLRHPLQLQGVSPFPWGAIVLLAINLRLTATKLKRDAYLDDAALAYTNPPPILRVIFKATGRIMNSLFAAFISSIFVIASSSLFIGAANLAKITDLSMAGLSAGLILLFLLLRRQTHPMWQIVQQQRPLVGWFLSLFLCVIFLCVTALLIPEGFKTPLTMPNVLARLLQSPELNQALFTQSFWSLAIIPTAIALARINRGYSLRAIMLSGLMPIGLIELITTLPVDLFTPSTPFTAALLILLGYGLMWREIYPLRAWPELRLGYHAYRHIKVRNPEQFMGRIKSLTAVCLYFMIPGGLSALMFLGIGALLPISLLIMSCLLGTVFLVLNA